MTQRKRKEKLKRGQSLTWDFLWPFKLVVLALYITFVGRADEGKSLQKKPDESRGEVK